MRLPAPGSALRATGVYVAVAGAWIVFSDGLLELLLSSPDAIALAQTVKGSAFVAVTGALLYLFLRRADRPAAEARPLSGPRRAWIPAGAFAALALCIGITGYLFFEHQRQSQKQQAEHALQAIATLKAEEIGTWLGERRSDAAAFGTGSFLATEVERLLGAGGAEGASARRVLARLAVLRDAYGYQGIAVFDRSGRALLGSPSAAAAADEVARGLVRTAAGSREATLTDLYRRPDGSYRLGVAMPLRAVTRGRLHTVAVLYMVIDPADRLFRIIRQWPTPSRTSESLLLRTGDGALLYPTASQHSPLPGELLGAGEATVEARDRRGLPVLAAAARVPGTDWAVVSKIDTAEVNAPINALRLRATAVTALLILAAAMAITFWWRGELARSRARHLRLELEQQALSRHYDYLTRHANDAIVLADEDGRVIEVNDRATTMYGYARAELLGMNARSFRPGDTAHSYDEDWSRAENAEGRVFEAMQRRRDGGTFPAEISARLIEVGGRRYRQAIVRDITRRKADEQRILRLGNLYACLSETSRGIVHSKSADELFAAVCQGVVRHGGFPSVWIGLVEEPSGAVQHVAHAGAIEGYLGQLRLSRDPQQPGGRGPTGRALRSGSSYVCNDFLADPDTAPWHALAEHTGVRAVAAFALRRGGRSVGVLSVHAAETDYFDDEIVATLQEMARAIGFALEGFERDYRRRQAEQQLRESEERYRRTMDAAMTGIYVIRDMTFRYVNPALAAMHGYTPGELVDRLGPLDLVAPEDRDRVRTRLSGDEPGSVRPYEIRALRKDGSTFEALVWGRGITYGGRAASVGTLVDLSEQKRAQASLRRALSEREELENIISRSSAIAFLWRAEPGWPVQFVSRNVAQLGHSVEELTAEGFLYEQIVHPEDRERVRSEVDEYTRENRSEFTQEYRLLTSEGDVRWVEDRTRVRRDVSGAITHYQGVVQDVTERKQAQEQQRLAAEVFENSHDAIVVTDGDARIVAVNEAFCRVTGYQREEAVGRNPRFLQSGRQERGFYEEMWAALTRTGYWKGELWNRRKSGELYPEWISISAVHDNTGRVSHYIGISTDISERKEADQRIRYLAHYDVLTSLPNRVLLGDRIRQAIAAARRAGTRVGVLFLDLDRFKDVNDSLGHDLGDAMLKAVAARITRCIREEDTVSRLGGDEFVVLIPDLHHAQDASIVVEKILGSLDKPLQVEGHEIYATASIGISVFPDDGGDSFTLLKNADAAMYHAKSTGRNTYKFFTRDLNARAYESMTMGNDLQRAIAREEFVLHYQPQVEIATGRIIGAEALIRWQHPERGLVSPAQFIPVAEDRGLIVPIGDWVLRTACHQAQAWREEGFGPLRMAVNLSALQFRDERLVEKIEAVLRETGLDAQSLELELTESVIMQEAAETLARIARLKAMGLYLSIDDFGTGYSSLSYLRRFKIDKLKIDQSFVSDIEDSDDAAAITTTIINMARNLNLDTLAEGVETPAQLEFLRAHGCAQLQGYLYSRPVPAAEFARLLGKKSQGPVPIGCARRGAELPAPRPNRAPHRSCGAEPR